MNYPCSNSTDLEIAIKSFSEIISKETLNTLQELIKEWKKKLHSIELNNDKSVTVKFPVQVFDSGHNQKFVDIDILICPKGLITWSMSTGMPCGSVEEAINKTNNYFSQMAAKYGNDKLSISLSAMIK